MIDKKTILNVALGVILAAFVVFAGWYVVDTRQMAKQNSTNVNEVINFINQNLLQSQENPEQVPTDF